MSSDNGELKFKEVPVDHVESLEGVFDGISNFADLVAGLRSAADHYEDLMKQDARITDPIVFGRVTFMVPGHTAEAEVWTEDEVEYTYNDGLHCTKCDPIIE